MGNGSSAVYRQIVSELDRRRREIGLSMWEVDDKAGTQDGYLGKCLYPDSPSGRQAGWDILDLLFSALWPTGFRIVIEPEDNEMQSTPGIRAKTDKNEHIRQVIHWRHSKYFQELGHKGGTACQAQLSKKQRRELARHAANARWRKRRKRRKGPA